MNAANSNFILFSRLKSSPQNSEAEDQSTEGASINSAHHDIYSKKLKKVVHSLDLDGGTLVIAQGESRNSKVLSILRKHDYDENLVLETINLETGKVLETRNYDDLLSQIRGKVQADYLHIAPLVCGRKRKIKPQSQESKTPKESVLFPNPFKDKVNIQVSFDDLKLTDEEIEKLLKIQTVSAKLSIVNMIDQQPVAPNNQPITFTIDSNSKTLRTSEPIDVRQLNKTLYAFRVSISDPKITGSRPIVIKGLKANEQ